MERLWNYSFQKNGAFSSINPDYTSRLYFPLMNHAGMRSSVTPELKGDINGGFDRYLMPPVVTEDLHRSLNARYFWLKVSGYPDWNINGLSPGQQLRKWGEDMEESVVEARPGLFEIRRKHFDSGLQVKFQLFVPNNDDMVELWKVQVSNTGDQTLTCTPFFAIPLFGRHADNLRDHRQVTTMFQKVYRDEAGTRIKPTIVHDEAGHRVNENQYFAYFYQQNGGVPDRIWTRMQDFIGEGGALNNPKAVRLNQDEPALPDNQRDGADSLGAAAFNEFEIEPGESRSFVGVIGLTEQDDSRLIAEKYKTAAKFDSSLENTLEYWQQLTQAIQLETGDSDFDEWINWLAFQLKARQIFGNSYLPDFGYGRGGRGWRDLWQDLLSIFLVDPGSASEEIVNNLKGIRVDGSNATIIGNKPGEFKADRNNIARSWCDHGAWPFFSLDFYIQQTGDLEVLLRKIPYWKDQFTARSRGIDKQWAVDQGNWQKDGSGKVIESSVFEHILLQQLSAFYHVGEHNILKLEGADWNDTLDMARERGESVCFESFYSGNLGRIIGLLKQLKSSGVNSIELITEALVLLDRTPGQIPVNYEDFDQKQSVLNQYFNQVRHTLSGKYEQVDVDHLIADLEAKQYHSSNKIRNQEWVDAGESGFFNGHYNNRGERMHGKVDGKYRMDLTSQVIPIMFDVASEEQIPMIYRSARKYLSSPDESGLRLCTPYEDLDLDVGRITGFVYGHKEHGSKWMQQNIMFMYGLYHRGFSSFGEDMLKDVFNLTHHNPNAKTFPGIPSYFEPGDRGSYMYLTGSSAWLYLTIVTQVFGVRGINGDLLLKPMIPGWLFDQNGRASIALTFGGQKIQVVYLNPGQSKAADWKIQSARINQKPIQANQNKELIILKDVLRSYERDRVIIELDLG